MLEDLVLPSKNKPCKFARERATLDEKDQQILDAALADPRWATNTLKRELASRGFAVSYEALQAHRTKECTCARES